MDNNLEYSLKTEDAFDSSSIKKCKKLFWGETGLPFRCWEPSQESCPHTRNAHVTDRGGLAHGVTGFNSDQSQVSMKNSNQSQVSIENFDQSRSFVKNFDQSQAFMRRASISLDQSEASVYICVVGLEKILPLWTNQEPAVLESFSLNRLGASILWTNQKSP